MTSQTKTKQAFTLIELLVVISIIALLIGILLPVLGAAREMGRQVKEMSAAKMLLVANQLYVNENKGKLFPSELISPDFKIVNDYGDVIWDPAGGTGAAGAQIGYSWRLAPYFNYEIKDALLVNRQSRILDQYDPTNYVFYSYVTSTAPSLGMNYYMGQDEHPILNPYGSLLIEDQVQLPSNMLVAASARNTNYADYPDGNRIVTRPSGGYDLDPLAGYFGAIDLRWNEKAVVAKLDGHASLMNEEEIASGGDVLWKGAQSN
ncbi:MAG: prepilin-type N-terminal cleavage/methylation domain-containing protein [Planctomycetota bacterium]